MKEPRRRRDADDPTSAVVVAMAAFNFYCFNRKGNCLFYKEWMRPLNTLSDDPDEEKKLM